MNLLEARKTTGLSQTDFAEKLSISRPTIARYELATSTPPPSLKYQVSKMFNIDIKELDF
jgi:transcriptional regulator with XRE-family HTH domain